MFRCYSYTIIREPINLCLLKLQLLKQSIKIHRCVVNTVYCQTVQYADTDKDLIQCVRLATNLVISLIILTPIKILQRNLNRSTFVVWEMNRNVCVVCVCSRCNILISGKIIKEMPGSLASGTGCITACSMTDSQNLITVANLFFLVLSKIF